MSHKENINSEDMGEADSVELEIGSSFEETSSDHEIFFKRYDKKFDDESSSMKVSLVKGPVYEETVVSKDNDKSNPSEIYMMLQKIMGSMEKLREDNKDIKDKVEDNNVSMEKLREDNNASIGKLEKKIEDNKVSVENLIKDKIEKLDKRIGDVDKENKANMKKLEKKVEKSFKENKLMIIDVEDRIEKYGLDCKVKYNVLENKLTEVCKSIGAIKQENVQNLQILDEKITKFREDSVTGEVLNKDGIYDEIHHFVSEEISSNIKLVSDQFDKRISGTIIKNKKYQEVNDMKFEEKEKECKQILLSYGDRTDSLENKLKFLEDKFQETRKDAVQDFEKVKEDIQNDLLNKMSVLKEDNVKNLYKKIEQVQNDFDSKIQSIENYTVNYPNNKGVNENIDLVGNNCITKVKAIVEDDNTVKLERSRVSNQIGSECRMGGSTMTNFIKVKSFSGENRENPLEYLHSLEELFLICKLTEQEKLAIACNYLYAYAKEWWRSLFDKPTTFGDFRYIILSCFWSEDRQDQIRYRVSQEKYNSSKGSYTQFFRSQAVKLKNLTAFPLSEQQILRILRHNLPKGIEQTLIAASCRNIEEAAEILDALEISELDNEIKPRNGKDKYSYNVSNMNVNPVSYGAFGDSGYIKDRKNPSYYKMHNNYSYNKGRVKNKEALVNSQPSTSGITTILKRPTIKGQSKMKSSN